MNDLEKSDVLIVVMIAEVSEMCLIYLRCKLYSDAKALKFLNMYNYFDNKYLLLS
jgi:hypothetical protein